jgi:transposase
MDAIYHLNPFTISKYHKTSDRSEKKCQKELIKITAHACLLQVNCDCFYQRYCKMWSEKNFQNFFKNKKRKPKKQKKGKKKRKKIIKKAWQTQQDL